MTTSQRTVLFLSVLTVSGTAWGQTFVSGLAHDPLGAATFGPVTDRRLPVQNIGSSGQDGVELALHSRHGGGVSVELTPMFGATGVQREIRVRPKGWDGTIKGHLRLISDPDGILSEVYDFSTNGATSLLWRLLDANGAVLDEGSVAGAVIGWGLDVPTPAPGATMNKSYTMAAGAVTSRADQGFFDITARAVTVTGLSSDPVPGVYSIEVTPVPCAGCPNDPWTDLQSIELSGDGMPDLVVADAHLDTFHLENWGLGQAHISEQCTPVCCPEDCDDTSDDRRLVVENLGSNGLDGVAIELGSNAGGVSVGVAKAACCRGHVIIMKLYDDVGQEQRISRTQVNAPSPDEEIDADFSSLGATGFRLTLFDDAGGVLGPPTGTEIISGGPRPYFTNQCPPGSTEWWINVGTSGNPVWVFQGCIGGYDFVVPGYGPVPGVSSFQIEPLNATTPAGRPVQCEITGTDDQGIVIEDVTAPSPPLFVSGLEHLPLGSAQFDPIVELLGPDGRRLAVHNLGSSGQDGVEVRMDSAFGGAVAVDVEPSLSIPGTEIRIRHKGWDGLIYGNHRLVSDGDGTGTFTFDFTDFGATAVNVVEYDTNGVPISNEDFGGPIVNKEWVPNFTCPDGSYPILVSGWRRVCPTCPWFFWYGWACSNGGTYTVENARVIVTPIRPPNHDPEPGFASTLVTASGVFDLTVSDASIDPFNVQCWGVGEGDIDEDCDGSCDFEDLHLAVGNLGSSGEDGVGIDFGPGTGGVSVAMGTPGCCRGHVIIMKLYDDEGQEQRISRTQIDELSPDEEIDADFSSLGATGYRITLFDETGAVVGPPGGTDIISGGPRPYFTNQCPPGSIEWWINVGTTSNPVWLFQGCIGGYDFVLPGYGSVPGVSSFQIEPLNATLTASKLKWARINSTDDLGLVIEDIEVRPLQIGDLDRDGDLDLVDYAIFGGCMAGPEATSPPSTCDPLRFHGGDLDGDGDLDLADFKDLQAAFTGG